MNANTSSSTGFFSLPYFGKITSGACLNKTQVIKQIDVPVSLLHPMNEAHSTANSNKRITNSKLIPEKKQDYHSTDKQYYVLKMNGDHMQASGILHNDLLIIEQCNTAKNNKIVIATIDNLETVIKLFEQTNDLIILSSKNSDIKPMIFDPSRIKILGTLAAQMRSYE